VALLVNNQETVTTLHFHVASLNATSAATRQPVVAVDAASRLFNPPPGYSVTDLWKGDAIPGTSMVLMRSCS
jgi:hypothetical protein